MGKPAGRWIQKGCWRDAVRKMMIRVSERFGVSSSTRVGPFRLEPWQQTLILGRFFGVRLGTAASHKS